MTDPDSESFSSEIKQTGDGSHTLYSHRYEQHYHNPNGAVGESRHLFFEKNGLRNRLRGNDTETELTILEVGFGTGLNFLILLDEIPDNSSEFAITYHSIEADPIDEKTARSLNFDQYLNLPDLTDRLTGIFEEIRPGMNRFDIMSGVKLHLFAGKFEEFDAAEPEADFIFHDPFSPEVNPELWTGNVFKKLAGWNRPDAILSTYCAASKARGAMCWAGWKVAREQGALRKREMTLASLNPENLTHLERVNEERLARRYEEEDF